MAKLFQSRFDLTRLPNPQLPKQDIEQGQSSIRPKSQLQQEKQGSAKRDPFGKTISMANRFKQFSEIQSTSHLAEFGVSIYNTRNYRDPFGKTISISNRFNQFSAISSTSHLPEYVLSDKNTGYVDRLLGNKNTGGQFVDQGVALQVLQNANRFYTIRKDFQDLTPKVSPINLKQFPFVARLFELGQVIKLNNVLEFQKPKITIPNIQIQKVRSGDRTVDPKIKIQRIDYNEVSIFNNNLILGVTVIPTLELRQLASNLIVNPNIEIKLTNAKSLIIDPEIKIERLTEFVIPDGEVIFISLNGITFNLPKIENKATYKLTGPLQGSTELVANQVPSEIKLYKPEPINFLAQANATSIRIKKVKEITKPEEVHGSVENTKLGAGGIKSKELIPNEFIKVPDVKESKLDLQLSLSRTISKERQSKEQNIVKVGSITDVERRHGSSNQLQVQGVRGLRRTNLENDAFLNSSLDQAKYSYYYTTDLNSLLISPILDALFISELGPQTSINTSAGPQDLSIYYGIPPRFPIVSIDGGNFGNNEVRPTFSDGKNPSNYGSMYDEGASSYTLVKAQTSSPLKPVGDDGTLTYTPPNAIVQSTYSPTQTIQPTDAASNWTSTSTQGLGYKALSYAEIKARRTSSDRPRKDFTVSTTDDGFEVWRVRLGMPDDGLGDTLYKSGNAVTNDFVRVKIGNIQFRSYITSFSDSYAPSFTDVNYIGRPDTLKVYKNSTRNISLGFKVAAFSDKDMKGIYQKLEKLVKDGTMSTISGDYAIGPMTKLSVGGWVQNAPVIISSLKLDTNPTEYTWDIIAEVPHIIDVSLDCVVLASNDGQPFSKGGTYIQYGQ